MPTFVANRKSIFNNNVSSPRETDSDDELHITDKILKEYINSKHEKSTINFSFKLMARA
jgi:hypothetical protein